MATKKKKRATTKRLAAAKTTRRRRSVGAVKTKSRRRRSVGAVGGEMEKLLFTGLGMLAARIVDKTVKNSKTLNLAPKDATGMDVRPYIVPVIGAVGYKFLKNPKAKAISAGMALYGVVNIVKDSSIPQLLDGVPNTVGRRLGMPQTVGKRKRTIYLNGTNPAQNKPDQMPMTIGTRQTMGALYMHGV